jgi:hypothetical protein
MLTTSSENILVVTLHGKVLPMNKATTQGCANIAFAK